MPYSRPDEDDPSAAAAKRNQTTAVILCGVIGALFDLELEQVQFKESKNAGIYIFKMRNMDRVKKENERRKRGKGR